MILARNSLTINFIIANFSRLVKFYLKIKKQMQFIFMKGENYLLKLMKNQNLNR